LPKRSAAKPRRAGSRRRRDADWTRLPDEQLLEVRLCDLRLTIEGTVLEARVERLYEELERRGLKFRPHAWLSTEWFSPDGVPGFAIPFYLAHKRLFELERHQMKDVERGTERWCMQLMRHEAAHALDSAYQLHRRRDWREVFGRWGAPYVPHYHPKPYSKRFVRHLELWYAQSHPAEDYAETFAVWLDPGSRWKTRYRGWPALSKLRYVDGLIDEIAGTTPKVRSRGLLEPLSELTITLGEYYEQKQMRYGRELLRAYDRDLKRLFPPPKEGKKGPSAAALLRRMRPEIRRLVAHSTGEYQYTIDRVLERMIDRTQELGLVVDRASKDSKRDAVVVLAVQTLKYLIRGHDRLTR